MCDADTCSATGAVSAGSVSGASAALALVAPRRISAITSTIAPMTSATVAANRTTSARTEPPSTGFGHPPNHEPPIHSGSTPISTSAVMPIAAGIASPRSSRSRWMRPSRSGSSSHATPYSSTAGAPSTAATATTPRTMIGSTPMRAATPAQTPPSQPSSRGTPSRRSQPKKPGSS
nr:hypothetical protein [Agromyces mangrovi]